MGRKKHRHHKSTRLSAARVKEIILQNHEPGRQDKCKLAVYRNKIAPLTGISERTFWRYLDELEDDPPRNENPNQLSLFE